MPLTMAGDGWCLLDEGRKEGEKKEKERESKTVSQTSQNILIFN